MTSAADTANLFEVNGAKECPKCRTLALVPGHGFVAGQDRPTPLTGRESAWFCFECGHQEPQPHGIVGKS